VSDPIRYEKSGAVARIVLDDGKANAMSVPWFEALDGALDSAEADGAGALVISGRAGFFSGGLNLKVLGTLTPEGVSELARHFAQTMLRVFALPMPTVASITGHAIAGGAVLAFACDTRIATAGAFKLQLNEVAIGIPMPTWMATIAASAVPTYRLTEALLHARAYTPEEAKAIGFVSALGATPEETETLAASAASQLAQLHRAAYAESKRRVRAPALERARASLDAETRRP
jgi:enoyl-CoA hydratase